MISNEMPVGIFDSGIGGLTVVKQMIDSLSNENIIYFGDTARVPYGSKSNDTVIDYAIQDAAFLLSKSVKAIVVACNTASSVALPALQAKFNLPILGVIEPGAMLAVNTTKNNKIGVIGTRATIANRAYSKAIESINPDLIVYESPCPLFVPLAEEGWLNHKATYAIAEQYLAEFTDLGIDTLILGCTHYPLLEKVIQEVIGSNVILIDSGVAAALELKSILNNYGLSNNSVTKASYEYFVSDLPVHFKNVAEMFLGMPVQKLSKVDLDILEVK